MVTSFKHIMYTQEIRGGLCDSVSGELGCDLIFFFCIYLLSVAVLIKHIVIIHYSKGCYKFSFYEPLQGSTK